MIVHASGRDDATLVRDAARPTHRDAVRFAQPVGLHALLRGNRVVAIENAVAVQQRRGREHGNLAACVRSEGSVVHCVLFEFGGFGREEEVAIGVLVKRTIMCCNRIIIDLYSYHNIFIHIFVNLPSIT